MPAFALYAGYEPVGIIHSEAGEWAIRLKMVYLFLVENQ